MTVVTASPTHAVDAAELVIQRERVEDVPAIDALVMKAFGPGRFAKTAERVREQSALSAGFTVFDGEDLIATVRLWSVKSGAAKGTFLGPIAVDGDKRSTGLGGQLVRQCIEESRDQGFDGVLLIGDPPYFQRFGFVPAPKAVFAGPVNARRVMWLPLTDVSPDGDVVPVA